MTPNNRTRKPLFLDGERVTFRELSRRCGIEENVIRARYRRLGWTLRQAVELDPYDWPGQNKITFRGIEYPSQEAFYDAVLDTTPRAVSTLRILLAKARKNGPLTNEVLEEIVYGKWGVEDTGGFLYRITCNPTCLVYIGITIRRVEDRWAAHISEANFGVDSPLKHAIREHGPDAFTIETVAHFETATELKRAERAAIEADSTVHPYGLNANKGGTLGSNDRKPFEFRGKKYRSLVELDRSLDYPTGTLNQRINANGMTLEEAVDFGPPRKAGRRTKNGREDWIARGTAFPSLQAIADQYGVPRQSLIGGMNRGDTLDGALDRLLTTGTCPACGASFKPRSRLHTYCSPACKEATRPPRKRGRKAGRGNRTPSIINGVEYASDSEVARVFNISRTRYRTLLKRGHTPEQAIRELTRNA